MSEFVYADYLSKVIKVCKIDQNANKCGRLGFKYATSSIMTQEELKDALRCLEYENYLKGCFHIGEQIGENRHSFKNNNIF